MPRTPERSRAPIDGEELRLETNAVAPAAPGRATFDGTDFVFADAAGSFNPRSAGTDDKRVKVSAGDTTPAFLLAKLVSGDSSVALALVGAGGDEKVDLSVDLTETFAAKQIETMVPFMSSSGVFVDAFVGTAEPFIDITRAGAYFIFFVATSFCDNNNAEGELALGKNGLAVIVGSSAGIGQNKVGTTVSTKHVTGLVPGDKIFGLYRKTIGGGSVNLRARSIIAFRIGD